MATSNWNLANALTISRVVISLILFSMISLGVKWHLCAILFVVGALTDALDGWIARKWQLVTVFGRIMDPFADKFLTIGVFVFLIPHRDSGVLPWMFIAILGREILITSLRGFLEQQGVDFSASSSGKLKMILQCVAVAFCIWQMDRTGLESWNSQVTYLRDGLLWLTVAVTVWSGADYVIRAVRLLNQPGESPK